MATSTFSKRQWCKQQDGTSDRHQDSIDQLEEACWNGLLNEMLPEVLEKGGLGGRLYLWYIWKSGSVLQIELGEQPLQIDEPYSIDPSLFLPTMEYN